MLTVVVDGPTNVLATFPFPEQIPQKKKRQQTLGIFAQLFKSNLERQCQIGISNTIF